jgi:uncharacterized protein (TIGR02001 family)
MLAIGIALFAIEARAQVSGRVSLASDYRFRGISLSDDRPSAQASINYDPPTSGWYAGGAAASACIDQQAVAQLLGYAGFVQRLQPNLSWEAGVTYSRFTGHESYAYAEAYAGITYRQLVMRLYYAPDYFNSGVPVWYGEINGSHALHGNWYLFGHLGFLRRNGNLSMDHTSRYRTDLRAGMGLSLKPVDLQLSWSGVHGGHGESYLFGYPVGNEVTRDAWIISLSYNW